MLVLAVFGLLFICAPTGIRYFLGAGPYFWFSSQIKIFILYTEKIKTNGIEKNTHYHILLHNNLPIYWLSDFLTQLLVAVRIRAIIIVKVFEKYKVLNECNTYSSL